MFNPFFPSFQAYNYELNLKNYLFAMQTLKNPLLPYMNNPNLWCPKMPNFFSPILNPENSKIINANNLNANQPSINEKIEENENSINSNLKKDDGKFILWTEIEDLLLSKLISNKYPQLSQNTSLKKTKIKWSKIADNLNDFLHNSDISNKKLGKHCRERWINHLNPSMNKGQWNINEDILLMQSYLKIGKKWSHISENVANRSQHSIKNRFYHLIAKQMNKTNREIIKSKELYKDEVILILEKLIAEKQVLNQNTNIKIENQNIKIELSESENIKTIA